MTHRQSTRLTRHARTGRLAAAATAGLLATTMLASGCDTVALISFTERNLQDVHSSGFSTPAGACQTGSSGDLVNRFVLVADDNRPIMLGDAVSLEAVELTPDNIELSNGAIFELPEGSGSGLGDSYTPADPTCTDDAACGAGFTCTFAPEIGNQDPELRACVQSDNMQLKRGADAVRFVSKVGATQVFGVLVENSTSIGGWQPEGATGFWDTDGDGVAETRVSATGSNSDLATDLSSYRIIGIQDMLVPFDSTQRQANERGVKSFFGLWSMSGLPQPPSLLSDTAADAGFTSSTSAMTAAFGELYNVGSGTALRDSRANVYQAAKYIIENKYTDANIESLYPATTDTEKVLTIVVDGPNDLRAGAGELPRTDIEELITAAKAQNVRIFVTHLDPARDVSELRDDPQYDDDQGAECTGDADCKNYERCRPLREYADSQDAQTATGNYCFPAYDVDGRIGPIADYARLACETGGGYIYTRSGSRLQQNLGWLPYSLDGLWEADLSSTAIPNTPFDEGDFVKVQGTMRVTVSGRSDSVDFSQVGDFGSQQNANYADSDTRSVVQVAAN